MSISHDFDSLLRQIKNEYSRISAENAAFHAYFLKTGVQARRFDGQGAILPAFSSHSATVRSFSPTIGPSAVEGNGSDLGGTAGIGILNELRRDKLERTMSDIPDESNDNRIRTGVDGYAWTRPRTMATWTKPFPKPLPGIFKEGESTSSLESTITMEDVPQAQPSTASPAGMNYQRITTLNSRRPSPSVWTGLSIAAAARTTEPKTGTSPSRRTTPHDHSTKTKFDVIWGSVINPAHDDFRKSLRRNLLTMRGQEVVEKYLEPVMCLVIFINMVLTGVSADTEWWNGWIWVDAFFTCIFIMEIGVKVSVFGLDDTFRGPQSRWNLFDCGIVALCVVDFVYTSSIKSPQRSVGTQKSDSKLGGSFSLFRMFRLARMVRMLRVLRIPVCKELWMMINGMVGGLRTLGWACVILTIPVYMLGMLLSQTLGVQERLETLQAAEQDKNVDSFNSVPMAMFTVVRCMTSECTDFKGRPLILEMVNKHGWVLGFLYVLFILLTMLGLFNLITAIFVENAVAAAKFNEAIQTKRRQRSREALTAKVRQLIQIFWEAQHDMLDRPRRSGSMESLRKNFSMHQCTDMQVTLELYEKVITLTSVQNILEDLEIAEDDYFDLFDILDTDGNGSLDVKEIVEGMLRLRGNARRSDVVGVGYAIRALQLSLGEFSEIMQWKMEELSRASAGPTNSGQKKVLKQNCKCLFSEGTERTCEPTEEHDC